MVKTNQKITPPPRFSMRIVPFLLAAAALASAPAAAAAPEPPPPITTWTGVTFNSGVAALPPSTPVLLEFFAHWCGACQRFAPVFEAAATQLSGSAITVARVDCANEATLCNLFNVRSYPTLHVASAATLAGVKGKNAPHLAKYGGAHEAGAVAAWAREEAAKLEAAGGGGGGHVPAKPAVTADTAALPAAVCVRVWWWWWMARAGGTLLGSQQTKKNSPPPLLSSLSQQTMDLHGLEKATVLTFEYALTGDAALAEPGARAALHAFASLVAAAHPLPACAAGAGTLLATLDRDWPVAAGAGGPPPVAALAALRAVRLCGPSPPPADWHACAPTPPHTGSGYTCGLWTLFHALAAGAGDGDTAGRVWLDSVAGWVAHFFACADCASHFGEMVASPAAQTVASGRDGRLWGWRAHNEVNARLATEDAAAGGTADPAHPKTQWPPRSLCPTCAAPAPGVGGAPQWNDGAVDSFLISYYGGPDRTARAAAAAAAAAHLGRRGLDGRDGRRTAGGGSPVVGVVIFGVVAAGAALGARAGRGAKGKEKH